MSCAPYRPRSSSTKVAAGSSSGPEPSPGLIALSNGNREPSIFAGLPDVVGRIGPYERLANEKANEIDFDRRETLLELSSLQLSEHVRQGRALISQIHRLLRNRDQLIAGGFRASARGGKEQKDCQKNSHCVPKCT